MNQVYYLLKRATDGIRRRPALHILSLVTLTATFLSFATSLTVAINIKHLVKSWVGSAELTIYLEEGATPDDIKQLAAALSDIPQISRVKTLTQKGAKAEFARNMAGYEEMIAALPDATFPASIDIHLASAVVTDMKARKSLAERIEQVAMVERVDLYDSWFSKLMAVSAVGQAAALGLGLLSAVVAVLVVSAVVRSSVSARAREIEVLALVGATRRYIRFPFQLEGAIQTVLAMILALLLLHVVADYLQDGLREIMPLIGMHTLARLGGKLLVVLVTGSALAGILGSRLSLKQVREGG